MREYGKQEFSLMDGIDFESTLPKISENERKNNKLYHYTSLNALNAMLSNSRCQSNEKIEFVMRATSGFSMNDSEEIKYGIDKFAHLLKIIENELNIKEHKLSDVLINKGKESSFYQFLKDELPQTNYIPFVISLTKEEDSLPMWKMYGDDFHGVRLEFSEYGLTQNLRTTNLFRSVMAEVTYKEIISPIKWRNRNNDDTVYFHLKTLYKLYISSIDTEGFCESPIKKKMQSLLLMVALALSFLKTKDWEMEKEWRLVYVELNPQNYRYRVSKEKNLIRHLEVPFPINAIEGIKVGPLVDDITIGTLNILLESLGCPFKATKSTISYRDF